MLTCRGSWNKPQAPRGEGIPFTIKQSLASVSSLTNASVVREFLSACSIMSQTQRCKQFPFSFIIIYFNNKNIKKRTSFWYKNKLHTIHSERPIKLYPAHIVHYIHTTGCYCISLTSHLDLLLIWQHYVLQVFNPTSVEPLTM